MNQNENCCEQCNDGYGGCIYPYYGASPHEAICETENGRIWQSSRPIPADQWPENFVPDTDTGNPPSAGTYTHCLNCGRKRIKNHDN